MSDLSEQLAKEFAKSFGALFECRVTLRDSSTSNKDKLRLIEQYLCTLDKGISSIFHIIKGGHNDHDTDKPNIHS